MSEVGVSRGEWARFWAVDLHVHTPASTDAAPEDFGTADDVVAAALEAGLSAIAITDHNSVASCGDMAAAARGTDLVVLPGFELSTPEGHLLGVWEAGTAPSLIEDVLIRLGIARTRFGDTAVVAAKSMSECAKEIHEAQGIAIAAHIDKDRGILTQPVNTYVNQLLAEPAITALEYVRDDTPARVEAKLRKRVRRTLVQGSDTYDPTLGRHALSGIGKRRTWIKAARPDLCGIRYALQDPDLRVRVAPPSVVTHPVIESLSISGGFLGGVELEFSPDLNCLLGGTGVGKSLALEAIRYALGQQVDPHLFTTIRDEVDRRLSAALREGSVVAVKVKCSDGRFRVSRVYADSGSAPRVEHLIGDEWVETDREPASIVGISAFSQGEILEYARQPVGRMALIDAKLDLSEIEGKIEGLVKDLESNADSLIQKREEVDALQESTADIARLTERERELSSVFESDLVKQQGKWADDLAKVRSMVEAIEGIEFRRPGIPDLSFDLSPEHEERHARVRGARDELLAAVNRAETEIIQKLANLRATASEVRYEMELEFSEFKQELDSTLEKSGSSTLALLRSELESVQMRLSAAQGAAEKLTVYAEPELRELESQREDLLERLKQARDERRRLRRARVMELSKKTAGSVKIDVPSRGDTSEYRKALDSLKVGSRLREQVLDLIADNIHPYKLVRAIWRGDTSQAGDLPSGVTSADISRLLANVADRNLWGELLSVQAIDTPDVLKIKFRKPGEQDYAYIEDLSHGQKCTAILVLLLADGENPVLVDQPEDALHAPWIEEYLVERLRQLRGTRQYIFATRSPGLVVSADAEQLITMRASSGRGDLEACGSLERYDLNELALHHLEGGKDPFKRRTQKLGVSLQS
jgi:hypothetical protein